MKETIEKTYEYVRTHGKAFESKLLSESAEQFPFLNPNDENHSYYLALFKEEVGSAHPKETSLAPPVPPAFIFTQYDKNEIIESVDLSIIKTTAEFIISTQLAQNDLDAPTTENITQSIVEKYGDDEKFKFLSPDHKLHPVFKQFLNQYKTIACDTTKNIIPQHKLLQRCLQRAAFKEYEDNQLATNDIKQKMFKLRFAAINWLDFTKKKTTVLSLVDYFPIDENKGELITSNMKVPLDFSNLLQNNISNDLTIRSLNTYFGNKSSQDETTDKSTDEAGNTEEPNKAKKRKGKLIRDAGETRLKRNKKK